MYNIEELYYSLLDVFVPIGGFVIGFIFMKVGFYIIENTIEGMAE